MRRARVAAITAGMLAAVAVADCGGSSKFDGTTILLQIFPSAPTVSTNFFSVLLMNASGACPLSPQATLAINGTTYPFGSCTGASTPFDGNPSFELQAADGDDEAQMAVAGLVPGVDAAVESPADNEVAASGSITVSIPAALQGQMPQIAEFQNVNDLDAYAGMDTYPSSSDSQTATFPPPKHAASYVFWVLMGSPIGPTESTPSANVLSCSGFARCFAEAVDVLGPMMITVTP